MKSRTCVEVNIPASAEIKITLVPAGECEAEWKMQNGSYVSLRFESKDVIPRMHAELLGLERNAETPHGA